MVCKSATMNKIEVISTNILADATKDCPVDKGNLRASGNKIRNDQEHKIYIGFGRGISKSYAVFQHENVGLYHKVGKAKWLQDAFDIHTQNTYQTNVVDDSYRFLMDRNHQLLH